jgi:quinol monooxygenase YgiN
MSMGSSPQPSVDEIEKKAAVRQAGSSISEKMRKESGNVPYRRAKDAQ